MKPIAKESRKRAGFTIIELLTIMSIIIILIGMIVPAMNAIKRYARRVLQKNQFHTIEVALDLYNAEWEGYPPSDNTGLSCGAMKLCEAMVGQDLQGYHPGTNFELRNSVYMDADLSIRRQYLKLESANAYTLEGLYGAGNTRPYDPAWYVLCDMYTNVTHKVTGESVGMPVLYYGANTSGTKHSVSSPYYAPEFDNGVSIEDPANIYNYLDNDLLVRLGMPWQPGFAHLMASSGATRHDPPLDSASAQVFYNKIWNNKLNIPLGRPYRADSYVLLSAGWDGEYGTDDDVFNFGN
jgi:competence protein ComGC